MQCPRCQYPNEKDARYCRLCFEILTVGAPDRLAFEMRKERQRNKSGFWVISKKGVQATFQGLTGLTQFLFRYYTFIIPVILLAAGIGWYKSHSSPLKKLRSHGAALNHQVPGPTPLRYLVGWHSEIKSWSEQNGQLDTPLGDNEVDETGTLVVENQVSSKAVQTVGVRPDEWIQSLKTPEGMQTYNIPFTHPSLSSGSIILDSQGTVVQRQNPLSLRLGRCLSFLMPMWPKGNHRIDEPWSEPIEWVEIIGEWKIFWKAQLHWTLKDFEPCANTHCAHLLYQAELSPQLWAAPSWAQGNVRSARFSGEGQGEVYFDPDTGRLISNLFSYEGTLILPITNLELIPIEVRVGRPLASGPGDIRIQFKNKLELRKPS